MAGTRRTATRPAISGTRIFGVETEYGFAVIGANGERLDPEVALVELMKRVRKLVPHLHHCGETDLFTSNGSRIYLDAGLHPEVATPECTTPEEAVAFTRAGDRLLARAAQTMARKWRHEEVDVVLWKANVDHASAATWASHESYLHQAPQSRFAEQLISHLVSRVIYTGAGGFNNRVPELSFVVSPRAFHLEHTISNESTYQRGIFHTRDEPLAESPNRRLHLLAGESLWSETADYLRIGSTALLVAMIDAGRRPQRGIDLASPLEAMAAFAADVTCSATVAMKPSGSLTAISIQRRLLECVEDDLSAGYMPSWATAVCNLWRRVLDSLESSPGSLIGVLDWPTKLAVLQRRCEAEGERWSFSSGRELAGCSALPANRACRKQVAAKLRETDMRFNRLDDRGIFAALDRDGAMDHRILPVEAVESALREPPSLGRARVRAACVARLADKGSGIVCDWTRIVDHDNSVMLDLGDPFQSEGEEWKALPRDARPPRRTDDSITEPIRSALFTGDIPEALRQISLLLTNTDPPSASRYRYCMMMIGTLVPTAPVPQLSGGEGVGSVLEILFQRVLGISDYSLEERVGTLLYRFHEANGRYAVARQVIEQLLRRAQQNGNHEAIAMLTNNLGYEHLLEEQWDEAETLFERAVGLYEYIGDHSEVVNVRANLLECRFGRIDADSWVALIPSVVELNRALVERGDWRARKTLRLLARFAAHRGRWRAARCWARRAVTASNGIETQLHKWDRDYLRGLEEQARAPSARR